jgi:hypothetical protein
MSERAWTEETMCELLRARVCRDSGNGPQAVLCPSVRSAAGFDARRTIDAVSLGLWPSRGMLLDGYEIKVSRSDWLRELKNPAKAEEFASRVDRLWLVISDKAIIKDGELPDNWGLLVRHGRQLRETVKARFLHEGRELPPGFNRSFLVPLLRAANAVPPDIRKELEAEAKRRWKSELDRAQEDLKALGEQVVAFEKAAGIRLVEWRHHGAEEAAKRGVSFAAAMAGEKGVENLQRTARHIADQAARLHEQALEIADPTREGVAA